MKKGNDIDNLFKNGLEHPDIPFNDADWQAMEKRLHPKPKRRIAPIIWFSALSGLAAMLLIVFFVMKPAAEKSDDLAKTKLLKIKKLNKNLSDKNGVKDNLKDKSITEELGNNKSIYFNNFEATTNSSHSKTNLLTNIKAGNMVEGNSILGLSNTALLSNNLYGGSLIESPNYSDLAMFSPGTNYKPKVGKPDNKIEIKNFSNKPRMVLSILAAPDLTSVQYSGKSSVSGSFGAELTVFLTKRLSVTTGAAYAKKIYNSEFSLYNPNSTYVFKNQPINIHANCDVIDIPLNVNYKIFEKRKNSLTLSTGLSSYLMLKEKYSYTYAENAQGRKEYEVKNQNKHYLGIANIGVEFQHKINNKFSISARPFMKLPLTDIGYGNMKLSSTGVAVSVNMNLFKKVN
ncbi:outer membrane beta-barrel protein [Pedobacter mendelii]|uniref:Outer membrane protein beta-barrel domain-containing protein n=1 Tax=Pedobacter mendelii TaxID=1908240 RepID=A0ABQ2BMH8_9SPHI|nr:outer membrane beta-barrel protein [Pedobacter mendelii]GGI27667.1 hypothetical protein GCM10008119_28790 [Pedobacter mendelii]